MDASVWERKTPEQQKTHYERLLTTPVLTADNVVVSSDGQEVWRFAPDGGKKKNQTKRKINARTTTVNKKQRHWRYVKHWFNLFFIADAYNC